MIYFADEFQFCSSIDPVSNVLNLLSHSSITCSWFIIYASRKAREQVETADQDASERITDTGIVWLCEELGIEYKLVTHDRDPVLSPASLKQIPGNETGTAPFLEDTSAGITLSESGAINDYIIHKYAGGRLALPPSDKHFADYIYWLHYANGTSQPAMIASFFMDNTGIAADA
jgi:glutathione S-transferase